jgi:hypothetical protein
MGVLAKKGIFNGRKVPVEGMRTVAPQQLALSMLSRELLANAGLERVTDKIIMKEDLTPKDVELLWKSASLSALMKLVQLKYTNLAPLTYVPVLYVQVDEILKATTPKQALSKISEKIDHYGSEQLRLWLSIRGFLEPSKEAYEFIALLHQKYPSVRLIAPSCSRIIAEIAAQSRVAPGITSGSPAAAVIQQLSEIGIYRLAESGCKEALVECHRLNMPNHIVSRVTRLDSTAFIKEIFILRALNKKEEVVSSWSPGLEDFVVLNPSKEFLVMKTLALGSLVLDNIPQRRLNSRALSLATLHLAPQLGSNTFIHAALDQRTSSALNLHLVDNLSPFFDKQT